MSVTGLEDLFLGVRVHLVRSTLDEEGTGGGLTNDHTPLLTND